MGKLIYATIASLDGYVADAEGKFDWSVPDAAVHTYVNDLSRQLGTYLYGRRMYEVMQYWESAPTTGDTTVFMKDFAAIWQAADKVVYSKTLGSVSTSRTRLERSFDPDSIRKMKETALRDIGIGGPTLAAEALRAGLVGECHFFLVPVIVGGGTPSVPDGIRINLKLLHEHRFNNGTVHLHYAISQ